MAYIDKTYTDSYKDYKEFKDWADQQHLTFYNGHTVCIGDWVWEIEEEDFVEGREIPIMNTPTWLDIYLIQNCKIDFVLSRMSYAYNDFFEEAKSINLSAPPSSDYKQNRKVRIKKSKRTDFPRHNRPYDGVTKWWVQCDKVKFYYDDETQTWSDGYYPMSTNTAHITSIKEIKKHLKRQYLPKGLEFRISGRYVGEEYIAVVL